MTLPVWRTSAGFLGTVTERTTATFLLSADYASSFSLISGKLPVGLSLSSIGIISGTVSSIGEEISNQFVIRAASSSGVTDRTFVIDTIGDSDLGWVTPAGFINAGIGKEYYVINRNPVDFQFEANPGQVILSLSASSTAKSTRLFLSTLTNVDTGQPGAWRYVGGDGIKNGTTVTSISTVYNPSKNGYPITISNPTESTISGTITLYDTLPFGQEIIYYIAENDGQIPPGLTLYKNGRLSGYVQDTLSVDARISVGGYDSDGYSNYPYDHGVLVNGRYIRILSKFVPKVYQFNITASDGVLNVKRAFKMLIVDPSHLLTDSAYTGTSMLLAGESSSLIRPTWLDPIWYGFTSTVGIVF